MDDQPDTRCPESSQEGARCIYEAGHEGRHFAKDLFSYYHWGEDGPAITNTPRQADRGPIHELDAGLYRAVIREGVPRIERETTVGAVTAILVPCSPEVVASMSEDWSEPVQWRIEDGEFVFRTVTA